jgi:hypothetical protein
MSTGFGPFSAPPLSIADTPQLRAELDQADDRFLNLDLGWRKNDAGVLRTLSKLPRGGELRDNAPDWQGDGMTGDLLGFLATYEVEAKKPDGSIWKAKEAEMPYIPQVGNNCTSRGMADGVDQLQMMTIADPPPDATASIEFIRVCVEATYAFGLFKAGMRGDSGCYGSAVAEGAHEIGFVPYTEVDGVDEEDRTRLREWANNPRAIVDKYSVIAGNFRVGSIARVTTYEECCAGLANRGIITVASNVGYVGTRDSRGIIRRRGSWAHQMYYGGCIRSDGVETLVQFQSWGPMNPQGPQPFHLPSYAWRTVKEDVEAQLAEGDSWLIRLFPGFIRVPLANRWTNRGWAG